MNINQSYKSPFDAPQDVGQLVSLLLSNASVVAGVLFLVFVIIAGYSMMYNAGGDPQKFSKGRDIITWAFVGFLIIFGAYWIIQIIQMILGLQGGPTDILK